MSPFVRYCAFALAAFFATLALAFTVRFAALGAGQLSSLATRLLTPAAPATAPKSPDRPAAAAAPKADGAVAVAAAKAPVAPPAPAPTQSSEPASPQSADDVRLILPAHVAAVTGEPFDLYYDGLVLARDPDDYKIEVTAPTLKGASERRRWRVVPAAADIGTHAVTVTVKDLSGKVLAEGQSKIDVVAPPKAPDALNVLVVGASDIHQGLVPNLLWTKLDTWSPGRVTFVGTHHPKPSLPIYRDLLPKVFHEGYGGWGWQLFVNHYMPGKEEFYKIPQSPFVFLEDGKPVLNVARYLEERGVKGKLGAAVFYIGINETFAANPDDSKDVDLTISTALGWADQLLEAFRAAAPEAQIFLVIPPPFTRSAPVFKARYASIKPEFGDAWRHRRIVQTLARRMIERYDGKSERLTLVPMPAAFDGVDGYWQIDPGHPNEYGAGLVANAIYAAMMGKFR